jgi:uroporphyrinogen-III synthase
MTADRVRSMGLEPVVMPLFAIEAVDWTLPDGDFDAVLITSANALLFGGEALSAIKHLPVLAVGAASAAAAASAGFEVAITGSSDGAAIVEQGIAAGYRRIIWLAGADHMPLESQLTKLITYRAKPIEPAPDFAQVLAFPPIVALHSARAARHFAALCEGQGIDISQIRLAVFSSAIAEAAGKGWRAVAIAEAPNDSALLSAAQSIAMQVDTK